MLNIEEIRKELGNYALKYEDSISYNIIAMMKTGKPGTIQINTRKMGHESFWPFAISQSINR